MYIVVCSSVMCVGSVYTSDSVHSVASWWLELCWRSGAIQAFLSLSLSNVNV